MASQTPAAAPRRLAVVPTDPLQLYTDKGIGHWLTDYFNPLGFFHQVYCLSPLETHEHDAYGMHVIPTPPAEFATRLRELKIDLVRAYGGFNAADVACLNRVPGVPVVVSVHDTNPQVLSDNVRYADHVLAVSSAVRDLLIARGVDAARIHRFSNRVDLNLFKPRTDAARLSDFNRRFPGRYRIIHVGRKTEQKNLDTLLRALQIIGDDYTLIAIGAGDESPYRDLAAQLAVSARVHFLQSVANDELPFYYSFCDCVCNPSRWEGFGIVLIEALACGAAVVSSDLAPMNEFIQSGVNGLLVRDYESASALATAIRAACTDDARRKTLQANARAAAEPFSKNAIDRQEVNYYRMFLEQRDKPAADPAAPKPAAQTPTAPLDPRWQWVQKMLNAGGSIIDLGAGANPVAGATVAVDYHIDPEQRGCGGGATINPEEFKRRGIQFVNARIDARLPFEDRQFDFAYSHHVFEHLDDPATACQEMMRIAKSGVIITPSVFADLAFGRPYHKWLIMDSADTLVFFAKRPNEDRPFGNHPNPFDVLLNMGDWSDAPVAGPAAELREKLQREWNTRTPVTEVVFCWSDRFNFEIFRDRPIIPALAAQPSEEKSATAPAPHSDVDQERAKWDAYYGQMQAPLETPIVRQFNDELATTIRRFLPAGARTLEAGCGEGFQSLALARLNQYDVSLLDFSQHALRHARAAFATENRAAKFIAGDAFEPGQPEFDLVFNAGVIEHYTFDEQTRLIRAMASRSRRFVLVLAPNAMCYWYWLWRLKVQRDGQWPYGKEVPQADLAPLFRAAGLHPVGQWFTGASWAETFSEQFAAGLSDQDRQLLREAQRNPALPPALRGYLVAGLATVQRESIALPPEFRQSGPLEEWREAEMRAALADALALRLGGEARVDRLERDRARLADELAQQRARIAELREWSRRQQEHLNERIALAESLGHKLDEQSAYAAALHNQIDQHTAVLAEIEATQQALQRHAQATEADYRQLHAWNSALTDRYDDLNRRRQTLESELSGIYNSTGWRVLQQMYKVRHALFPRGSRREKIGKAGMQMLRRLRGRRPATAPSGPSPALPDQSLERQRPGIQAETAIVPNSLDVPGLVSVILPVYNQADLLPSSIDSVLAQTYDNFELVILNDGSKDNINEVLARYASNPKIRLLTQPNQKLPKALSNAFEFARGEFRTWTSADNLMEPRQLERQVAFLRAHPDAAMVYADYWAIDDRGEPLRNPNWRPHNRRTPDSPEIHLPHTTENLNNVQDNFIGACFMYRGWVGRLIGEYAPEMGFEDYDYWMRINHFFPIRHLGTDELLYKYRVHDNSLSGRAGELKIVDRVEAFMDFERQRQKHHAQPFTILADAAARKWLNALNVAPHRLTDWNPTAAPTGEKQLILLSAAALPQLTNWSKPANTALAVYFDADPRAPYKHRREITEKIDLCFASDSATLDRLALFTDRAIPAAPGQDLLTKALAAANNTLAFHAKFSPADRQRTLPEIFEPPDTRRRILLQIESFGGGGLEQVVLDLAHVLRDERCDVSILVTREEGLAADRARAAGFEVLRLPRHTAAYQELLENRRIELISAHQTLFGAETAAALRIPFVQTIHNTCVWFSRDQIAQYQQHAQHAAALACVSNNAAYYADVRLGLPPAKLAVIPNGIDVAGLRAAFAKADRTALRAKWNIAPTDFVLLNPAAIYPPKAQLQTVRALAQVVRSCTSHSDSPDVLPVVRSSTSQPPVGRSSTSSRLRVLFLGRDFDPAYAARVRREAADLNLGDAAIFAGFQPDVANFYALADAFLLPSYWEGWSIALAEALALGLPIVATDVGSAGELLAQTGGELVRPSFADIIDLAAANLASHTDGRDPAFIDRLAAAMLRIAQNPTPPRISAELAARLDRRTAYTQYARIFRWLISGGSLAGARAWLRKFQ